MCARLASAIMSVSSTKVRMVPQQAVRDIIQEYSLPCQAKTQSTLLCLPHRSVSTVCLSNQRDNRPSALTLPPRSSDKSRYWRELAALTLPDTQALQPCQAQ